MAILQLIRWKNLLLISFTQIVIWYFLCQALLDNNIDIALSIIEFSLLSLSTLLIAAGGYIINDIFDVEIDKINKAEKVIVSKHLSIKQSYKLYYLTVVLSIMISIYLAIVQQRGQLLWIPPIICLLLFAYAKYFKSGFLFGNIIISIFVAAVPGIVILGESIAIKKLTLFEPTKVAIIGSYIGFAFLINLIREIIKDIEDMEGDAVQNCQTIPIVLGKRKAVNVCILLSVLLVILMFFGLYFGLQSINTPLILLSSGILLLLTFLLFKMITAKNKEAFHQVSSLIKFVMFTALVGLLFCL